MKYVVLLAALLIHTSALANGPLDLKWTAEAKWLQKKFTLKPIGNKEWNLRVVDTCSQTDSSCVARDETYKVQLHVEADHRSYSNLLILRLTSNVYLNVKTDQNGNHTFESLSYYHGEDRDDLPLTLQLY